MKVEPTAVSHHPMSMPYARIIANALGVPDFELVDDSKKIEFMHAMCQFHDAMAERGWGDYGSMQRVHNRDDASPWGERVVSRDEMQKYRDTLQQHLADGGSILDAADVLGVNQRQVIAVFCNNQSSATAWNMDEGQWRAAEQAAAGVISIREFGRRIDLSQTSTSYLVWKLRGEDRGWFGRPNGRPVAAKADLDTEREGS